MGLAVGFWQEVQLKVAAFAHTKLPAPLPSKAVLLPGQIVTSLPALADGNEGVVIDIISVAVPQLFVTVSV